MQKRLTENGLNEELEGLLRREPRLAPARPTDGPLSLRRRPPGFPGLLRILAAQQVSTASADAVFTRLVAEGFDDPATAAAAGVDGLRACGLTRGKAGYAHGLATAAQSGALDFDALAAMETDAAMAALTAHKGVGLWSAEVYLLVCEGRADVFPAGDLALRAAAGRLLCDGDRPEIDALRAMAASWSPHRGVAALLLWADYERVLGRAGAP